MGSMSHKSLTFALSFFRFALYQTSLFVKLLNFTIACQPITNYANSKMLGEPVEHSESVGGVPAHCHTGQASEGFFVGSRCHCYL